jgi:hypothetical protein
MFNRLNRALQQALDPDGSKAQSEQLRQPTIESLLPSDVVSLWDAGDAVVEAVIECREELNGRETTWRWNLLDGGRMLAVEPEGNVLYTRTVVLHQGSAEFETLTSDPAQGGVLKAFEARVRESTAGRHPVLFEYQGKPYRVVATGVFDARPVGVPSYAPGAYSKAEVWRDINPTNPGDNVYFELEPTDPAPGEDTEVLGIWTSHIALLFGKPLSGADIQSIYPHA